MIFSGTRVVPRLIFSYSPCFLFLVSTLIYVESQVLSWHLPRQISFLYLSKTVLENLPGQIFHLQILHVFVYLVFLSGPLLAVVFLSVMITHKLETVSGDTFMY